jgi:hypothetical protein
MKKSHLIGLFALVMLVAGCTKDEEARVVGNSATSGTKVDMTTEQESRARKMVRRMPKLRYWDETNNRFIDFNPTTRDFEFTDPDEGFVFDDPDGNNAMVFYDGTDSYLVFSAGIGVSGQGGGGTVVAGSTTLDMDFTVCLSMQEVAAGDGTVDFFSDGSGVFDEYAAVIGIAGDFEALANADASGNSSFDPFEYLQGYAEFYVIADDVSGNHEVFNWMDAEADPEDFDDMASAMVFDFQDFSLYFANSGQVNVSGGTMEFNGTFIGFLDFLDVFLEDSSEEIDMEAVEVSGYGSMGCN